MRAEYGVLTRQGAFAIPTEVGGGLKVRGLPLMHDKTVNEWGTAALGYFMTGPPARSSAGNTAMVRMLDLATLFADSFLSLRCI